MDKWAVMWKTGEWLSFPTRKLAREYIKTDFGQSLGKVHKVKIRVIK